MLIRIGRYEVAISARLIGNEGEASASSTESIVHVLECACRDAARYNHIEGFHGTSLRICMIVEALHDALEAVGYYD